MDGCLRRARARVCRDGLRSAHPRARDRVAWSRSDHARLGRSSSVEPSGTIDCSWGGHRCSPDRQCAFPDHVAARGGVRRGGARIDASRGEPSCARRHPGGASARGWAGRDRVGGTGVHASLCVVRSSTRVGPSLPRVNGRCALVVGPLGMDRPTSPRPAPLWGAVRRG